MITFNVTPEHINTGDYTCKNCPIAMAIRDRLREINPGHEFYIMVWAHHIRIATYTHRTFIYTSDKLSDDLTKWINRFDWKLPVNPIEFSLDIDEELVRKQQPSLCQY